MKKNNVKKFKLFLIILIFSVYFIISSFVNNLPGTKTSPDSDLKNQYINLNIENININESGLDLFELEKYKLISIIDGDTIKILYKDGEKKSIRMIGLDAPESYKTRFGYKECFGDESSDYLKKIIGNAEFVQIEIDETQGKNGLDKYGRILGYVFLNLENLNGKMIEEGYGWEYTYKNNKYKYQKEFMEFENIASKNKIGLWQKKSCNGKRIRLENN